MITAPYNFVPLNNEVFYPDWDKDISHDVPFEDGESGEIIIEVTAKSPIFIRNSSKDKEKLSSEFCHFLSANGGKEYYIPGSSMKGMIRSMLEVMSFSKIRVDEEKLKKPLSVRDMTQDRRTGEIFNYPMVATSQKCGFLSINDDGTGSIENCGKPIVIHHSELKNKFNIDGIKNLNTAKEKYKKLGTVEKSIKVKIEKVGRQKKAFKNDANKEGRLVLTGNIDGKKHEFVFISQNNNLAVNKNVIDNFKKVYFDNEEMIDGKFWQNKLKTGTSIKIPVFYTENENKIESIGLTQIFKLAYNKTLLEAAKQNFDSDRLDLAEAIFGTEKENLALKGRVQFSHFKSTLIRFEQRKKEEVLGTPNPTYYPNYIRQTDIHGSKVNKYMTLMDKNAQISGWKRYPLQNKIRSFPLPENDKGEVNHDVATVFEPLDSGSVFIGKLRFHNLKKSEIGALLSALTFHGQENDHLHNIGMAKALGYGKVDIQLKEVKYLQYSQDKYIDSFETLMNAWELKEYDSWLKSSQIENLFAMCNIKNEKTLTYQKLLNSSGKNDFVEDKKQKKYLVPYFIDKTSTKKAKNTVEKVSNHGNRPKTTSIKVFSIKEIADEVSSTIEEVIKFSVGLHFGKLTPSSTLKEQQAKDLINRIKNKSQTNSQKENIVLSGISKTKIRKTITAYWQQEYNIMYHRNQILEFFSNEGFNTTPEDQRKVYNDKREDAEFVKILKDIHMLEFGELAEEKKEALFKKLTE